MATIQERARKAFNAINKEEYQCALSEAQVYEDAFNHVKQEYEVAENAFIQGVAYEHVRLINKACEWLIDNRIMATNKPPYGFYIEDFKKAMEE